MKTSRIGLVLIVLAGCTSERLALTPDLPPERVLQRQASVQAKPKPIIPAKPWPAALVSLSGPDSGPDLPIWTIAAPKPSGVMSRTLTPVQLFDKVSPAVYAVNMAGRFRGSAVAVSSREAITNCHVVARSGPIVLVNPAATHNAVVVAADIATDRCYLRVQGGELEPVQGLRDYATLSVGETVFTIGSPKGMVNTLGNGLLSGLREMEGVEYAQITAPVSRGSSGGGLFDDRGNLIGVTTFTIQDSQNLNFAIAASQFWR
jgi:S1-C subfamily serine protease